MPKHGQFIGAGFEDPPFSPSDGSPSGGADVMGGVEMDAGGKETANDCGCEAVTLMNVTGSDLGIGDTIGIQKNGAGLVAVAAGVRQPFMKIPDLG
jgi:hypothetical protein